MLKLTTLVVTAATAFAVAAGTASADVPNASTSVSSLGGTTTATCTSALMPGVPFQYGAWGDFIDGCTARIACPANTAGCTASMSTYIAAYGRPFANVTQNARLRVFDSAGRNIWFRDRSCAGSMSCGNSDAIAIAPGQSASAQCNGVRQHIPAGAPPAANTCSVSIRPY